jgi:hypothetical protein
LTTNSHSALTKTRSHEDRETFTSVVPSSLRCLRAADYQPPRQAAVVFEFANADPIIGTIDLITMLIDEGCWPAESA